MSDRLRHVALSGCTVDLTSGRISTGGQLRPMEVRLLAYLADHLGEVVSQAELLREVWRYAPKVRSATLYTTVHRLRAAIEPDPATPRHLVTDAARGLRLVDVVVEPVGGSGLGPEDDPIVGRDAELAQLRTPGLWTLFGLRGVGKTRIARAHARARAVEGASVWVIDLAEAPSADLADVQARIAAAVGLRQDADPGRELARLGPVVVVLDGADLVDDLGPAALAWLRAAPEAQIVVTRCTPLPHGGEGRMRVDPLPVLESAELLLRRIRAVAPAFDPDPVAAELDALVRRLDGLPLALEIVAPYAAALGVGTVLASVRAGESLDDPARPRHHRSIRDALDATRATLPDHGFAAISQLAAFVGPLLPSVAAEVVSLPSGAPPLPRLLLGMVEGGWLRAVPGGDRLALLETVRAWVGPPDPGAVARHRERYLARAAQVFEDSHGLVDTPDDDDGLEALHAARAALETPEDPRWTPLLAYALRAASPNHPAAAGALASALLRTPLARRSWVYVAWWQAAHLAAVGRQIEAGELWARIDEAAERAGLPAVAVLAAMFHASCSSNTGSMREASAQLDRADQRLAGLPGVPPSIAAVLRSRSLGIRAILDHPRQVPLLREAVDVLRGSGRAGALASARAALVGALADAGRNPEALVEGELGLATDPPHFRITRVNLLFGLASALRRMGRPQEALRHLDAAAALVEEHRLVHRWVVGIGRAEVLMSVGRFDEARGVALAMRDAAERDGRAREATEAVRIWALAGRRAGAPDQVDALRVAFDAVVHRAQWANVSDLVRDLADVWVEGRSSLDPRRLTASLVKRDDLGVERVAVALIHAELLRRAGDREGALATLHALPDDGTDLRMARAALAAELGDLRAAHTVLDALPDAAPRPWTSIWRARCAAELGRADEVAASIREVEPAPWEAALASARAELLSGLQRMSDDV